MRTNCQAHDQYPTGNRHEIALHLQVQDLAALAGVHRTTVKEAPGNVRLQGSLREALRVLSRPLYLLVSQFPYS